MEKLYIGNGIWLDILSDKIDISDIEKPFKMDNYDCLNCRDYLMCRNGDYVYVIRDLCLSC